MLVEGKLIEVHLKYAVIKAYIWEIIGNIIYAYDAKDKTTQYKFIEGYHEIKEVNEMMYEEFYKQFHERYIKKDYRFYAVGENDGTTTVVVENNYYNVFIHFRLDGTFDVSGVNKSVQKKYENDERYMYEYYDGTKPQVVKKLSSIFNLIERRYEF